MNSNTEDTEAIRENLNSETAKIPWVELQQFFAAGRTLCVEADLDLIEVAFALHQDNTRQVQQWLEGSQVSPVSDSQAKHWFAAKSILWAVVVKPWVLIQLPE